MLSLKTRCSPKLFFFLWPNTSFHLFLPSNLKYKVEDSPYVREQRKLQGKEVVAWSKGVKGNAEKPIVISGPSGVGNSLLINVAWRKRFKDGKFLSLRLFTVTSIESVEVVTDSGKRCILDIDVQGARSVKESSLDATFIFVCPPSMKELEDRLRARYKNQAFTT